MLCHGKEQQNKCKIWRCWYIYQIITENMENCENTTQMWIEVWVQYFTHELISHSFPSNEHFISTNLFSLIILSFTEVAESVDRLPGNLWTENSDVVRSHTNARHIHRYCISINSSTHTHIHVFIYCRTQWTFFALRVFQKIFEFPLKMKSLPPSDIIIKLCCARSAIWNSEITAAIIPATNKKQISNY